MAKKSKKDIKKEEVEISFGAAESPEQIPGPHKKTRKARTKKSDITDFERGYQLGRKHENELKSERI